MFHGRLSASSDKRVKMKSNLESDRWHTGQPLKNTTLWRSQSILETHIQLSGIILSQWTSVAREISKSVGSRGEGGQKFSNSRYKNVGCKSRNCEKCGRSTSLRRSSVLAPLRWTKSSDSNGIVIMMCCMFTAHRYGLVQIQSRPSGLHLIRLTPMVAI